MYKHVSALAVLALLTAAPALHAQVIDVTPEQQAYDGRTDAQIRSWIHENNREVTEEERTFVNEHWRRAARLWRIRRLAKDAGDMGTVTRVDALLARADRVLEREIRRLQARAPIMTFAPSSVEVTQAPPPPQVEVQGVMPGPGQVWTPGFWQWNGSRHVWMGGHWAAPPQAGMVWEPARWENRNGRWGFNDGRWRVGAVAPNVVYEPPVEQEVVVQVAPPAPLVEVRPAGPAGGVWIPGYWHWNGQRHVWLGGRWSAARAGFRWEPDHWQHFNNGYRRVPGRWTR